MSATKQALTEIGNEWLNVYDFVGLEVGKALVLQNTGSTTLMLHVSAEKPPQSATGRHLYPLEIEWLNAQQVGLWVKAVPKTFGLSRLQVDDIGGLDKTGSNLGDTDTAQNLNIQTTIQTIPANNYIDLLITNTSDNELEINQILNLQVASVGNEGGSIFSLEFIFNVDLSGATILPATSQAYINSSSGDFNNITNNGIDFNIVEDLNPALNTDLLRISGGAVSYYASNQSVSITSISNDLLINQPYIIYSGGSMIARGRNLPILDGGTDLLNSLLLAGKFTPTQ